MPCFFTVFHFSPFSTLSLSAWLSSRALLCGLQRYSCYFFAPISIWWLQQQQAQQQQQQWVRAEQQTPCRAPFSSCFLKRKRKRFSYACARTPIHFTPGKYACVFVGVSVCVCCVSLHVAVSLSGCFVQVSVCLAVCLRVCVSECTHLIQVGADNMK